VQSGCVTFFHSAGRNPRRKGTDLLLDAFACLEHPARLVIHAQQGLPAGMPEHVRRIDELRQAARLELHVGDVPEPGLYHLGDVYVYPTRLEGIGLTVAEALSCGLPAVVPDCPPMNEFVTEESGRLVAVERYQPRYDGYYWPQCFVDPADLVQQMRWYCENAARLAELKRAARARAERALDWNHNGRELPRILAREARVEHEPRRRARAAALAFERRRIDPRLFYPATTRILLKAAQYLRPLASRYSGR
jgi:glycosyltransferase involved in cell wall biosynthesis